jgi:hypothetical protein
MDTKTINNKSILQKSFDRGISGFGAMAVQVTSLMWLRTSMNYQYRHGTGLGTIHTIKNLYNQGGIVRFYRGYGAAITIGPLARFFDTTSNSYMMEFLERENVHVGIKTAMGSVVAASARSFLMPLDTLKTTKQVEGKDGYKILKHKVKNNGLRVLYHGTGASVTATFVGHYPWFLTYNLLNEKLPVYSKDENFKNHLRNGFIGFNSAVISDCFSNSFRVIKTSKQTYPYKITYPKLINNIIKEDGILGLLGRGLKIRIITNGAQGIVFTIVWKYLQEINN